jgi:hypothetical protein
LAFTSTITTPFQIRRTILQGHGAKLGRIEVKMTLKIIAHEDRTEPGDGGAITDVITVGIPFHHDRALENPLPVVPQRRA